MTPHKAFFIIFIILFKKQVGINTRNINPLIVSTSAQIEVY